MLDAAPHATLEPAFVIDLVPPEYLAGTWPHVVRRMQSFVERSHGRVTLDTTVQRLANREWQLWLVSHGKTVDGCVLTHVYTADSGMKLCEILACMGDDATRWVHLLRDIETWAAENGCYRVQAWARKGWAKHLADYKLTHVLLEKDI